MIVVVHRWCMIVVVASVVLCRGSIGGVMIVVVASVVL